LCRILEQIRSRRLKDRNISRFSILKDHHHADGFISSAKSICRQLMPRTGAGRPALARTRGYHHIAGSAPEDRIVNPDADPEDTLGNRNPYVQIDEIHPPVHHPGWRGSPPGPQGIQPVRPIHVATGRYQERCGHKRYRARRGRAYRDDRACR